MVSSIFSDGALAVTAVALFIVLTVVVATRWHDHLHDRERLGGRRTRPSTHPEGQTAPMRTRPTPQPPLPYRG